MRIKKLVRPLGSLIGALCLSASVFAAVDYEEQGGMVVIEAEDFAHQAKDDIRRWFRFDGTTTAHGMDDSDRHHLKGAGDVAYIELLPDTRANHDQELIPSVNFNNEPGKMAILSYPVQFNSPGRYYVWARVFSTGLEDNGLHIGLNGEWPESGRRLQLCEGKYQWTWSSAQRVESNHCGYPKTIWLDIDKPGVHNVQVSMREDGVDLDQLLLTKDKAYTPPSEPLERTVSTKSGFQAKSKLQGLIEYKNIYFATEDFSFEKPLYVDENRGALGINATIKSARDKFLDASMQWKGSKPTVVDLVLVTLTEIDGESDYKISVNDREVARFTNPTSDEDYQESYFKASGVTLNKGDTITVSSSAKSNGKIPENDEFAFARGRWSALVLQRPADGTVAEMGKEKAAIKLLAKDLTQQGTGYHYMGKGLGIRGRDGVGKAEVKATVPVGNTDFDIEFHATAQATGSSTHEVILGGVSLGEFTVTASEKDNESFVKSWKDVGINAGDAIVIRSKNGSKDGAVYSDARWSHISFLAKGIDPGRMKSNLENARLQDDIESGSKLHGDRKESGDGSIQISGELRQWHPVTLTMDGPFAHELDNAPNPFLDYRMSVTFSHESGVPTYTVPGYFAADGNAAETSADKGTAWRAHVSPDKVGKWSYHVSFVKGDDAAVVPSAGNTLSPYHNVRGSFNVSKTNKRGDDFRAKGRLAYVGARYLRHAGNGEYFLKAGTDAPETLLAYDEFDNTINMKPNLPLKTWAPHAQDYREGDPTWQDGRGKNIIGVMNYLADKGVNVVSFLTYNAAGDGDNVWPYVERNGKLHFDSSKLDQWNTVFAHAQNRGIYLHFKLQENESDDHRRGGNTYIPEAMDAGKLGIERKLYFREMVARYAHHLALNWNLGEENTQSYEEQRNMAEYIDNLDAFDHNLVIHSFPNQQEKVYKQLLGANSVITGTSLQNHWSKAHKQTLHWIEKSQAAGKPWVVANDEQNPAQTGVPTDPGYNGKDGIARHNGQAYDLHDIRKYTLWGNLMAGGAGVEYYFGYKIDENDLYAEDLRSRDRSWGYAAIALDFFRDHKLPIQRMRNMNELVGNMDANNSQYCFGHEGEVYLVYLPKGGSAEIDLSHESTKKQFTVSWFDPRNGGKLQKGTVKKVKGGQKISLGSSKTDQKEDWLIMLKAK